jgi:hypothetical protein
MMFRSGFTLEAGAPRGPLWVFAACGLLAALAACDYDSGTHGVRSACAEPGGAGLDCEPLPIETAEDACWKLVECGAIALEAEGRFDWDRCVSHVRGLPSYRQDFALACIEGARCDELLFAGSPNPSRNPSNFPPCLQHGDQ